MTRIDTSPALSDFFDAVSMGPTDMQSLMTLVEKLQDPSDKRRAIEAIDTAQAISISDRNTLIAVLSETEIPTNTHWVTRNIVTPEGGRNISAWTPPTSIDTTHSNTNQIETPVEGLQFISSRLPEGVSQNDALNLALEEIGKPITSEKIRGYQIEHNIGIDTTNVKIGPETYGEMYATVLEKKLRTSMRNGYISESLQGEILELFSYANPKGINSVMLLQYVYLIGREGEEDLGNDRFKQVYGDFFEQVETKVSAQVITPENQAAGVAVLETRSENGLSVGGGIIAMAEGEMTTGEFIEEFKGIGMLVGVVAFIFFGNKIPGMENVGLLGRIGILVAGKLLGADKLIGYGADKLADEVSATGDYIRSPEAQAHLDTGREFIGDLWNTLRDGETYGTTIDEAKRIFGETVSGMEGINESFRESDMSKYIEGFTGKTSIILSDPGFLNTSKEQVLAISSLDDLKAVMSDSGYDTLISNHNMDNSDVAIFITEHMTIRLADSDNSELVRRAFFGSNVISATQEIVANSGAHLNSNPNIHSFLHTEISNIANGRGSETFKQAARDIGVALQLGNFDIYSLENYNSLSPEEAQLLNGLYTKITAILGIQEYVTNEVIRIQAIEVKTTGLTDTLQTLEQDLQDLEDINTAFELDPLFVTGSTLNSSDYDTTPFQAAYTAKKLEILRYARDTLEVNEIGGIDIESELGAVEAQEQYLNAQREFTELMNSFTPLPIEGSSVLDIRRWFDINKASMDRLGDLRLTLENINPAEGSQGYTLLQEMGVEFDQVGDTLFQRYESAVTHATESILQLTADIEAIDGDTTDVATYQQAKILLAQISQDYDEVLSGIILTWTVKRGDDITSFFHNLVLGNPTGFDEINRESNSLTYMNTQLQRDQVVDILGVKDAMRAKLIQLETNLNVEIPDLSSFNVTETTDIRRIKDILRANTLIVDQFLDNDLAEDRLRDIQTEVSKVEGLFIDALRRNSSDEAELRRIFLDYQLEFRDFLKANGEKSGNWFTSYFEEDRVEIVFNEMLDGVQNITEENQRKEYLKGITLTKVEIEGYAIIQLMSEEDIVKTYLEGLSTDDEDLVTVTGFEFYHLMKSWSTNPNLANYRREINDYITGIETSVEDKFQ